MAVDLPPLAQSESLGRGVFSSRRATKAAAGKPIQHDVFLAGESISVDRLDHTTREIMTQIAEQTAQGRSKPFYGWAVVTVEAASRNRRSVRPDGVANNPYHTEIDLNLKRGDDLKDQQKQHAQELALSAVWRERSL